MKGTGITKHGDGRLYLFFLDGQGDLLASPRMYYPTLLGSKKEDKVHQTIGQIILPLELAL